MSEYVLRNPLAFLNLPQPDEQPQNRQPRARRAGVARLDETARERVHRIPATNPTGERTMTKRLLLAALVFVPGVLAAAPAVLLATSVAGGVAVKAVVGPVKGCAIIPGATSLIIDLVGTAGTAAAGTSILQPTAGPATGFQCGPLDAGVSVSVNCLAGGACSWTGYQY
jgi:hypothetical protein